MPTNSPATPPPNNAVKGKKGFTKIPISQRIDKYTDKSGDCWLWTASCNENGYGQIWDSGRLRAAHVVSFELAGGNIPHGFVINHLCEVRGCVNPAHLEAVHPNDNMSYRKRRVLKLLDDRKKLVEALRTMLSHYSDCREALASSGFLKGDGKEETPAMQSARALLRSLGEAQ